MKKKREEQSGRQKPSPGDRPFPKKRLSQVLLKNRHYCELMCAELKNHDVTHVLEIGPGQGFLTGVLDQAGFNVLAVELDERMTEYLAGSNLFSQRVKIVHKDFLDFDLALWNPAGKAAIIGNIPYQISSKILEKTLPFLSRFAPQIFLVQLEFGRRVCAQVNTKDRSSLSVFAQMQSMPRILTTVGRGNFFPVPNVDSAILVLDPLLSPPQLEDQTGALKLSRQAFTQRRKMLSNSLKSFLPEVIESVDLKKRPEHLSIEEWLALGREVSNG